MKSIASVLALIALASTLTLGASAQQQTFSTAHAGPTGPVPVITGQPVNVYPFVSCNGQGAKKPPKAGTTSTKGSNKSAQQNPCTGSRPTSRPSHRPSPRPTR